MHFAQASTEWSNAYLEFTFEYGVQIIYSIVHHFVSSHYLITFCHVNHV